MPNVKRTGRRPLLDKLEKGGGWSSPVRTGYAQGSGLTSAKAYNDVNRGIGKLFDFFIDMFEEVFDVKLNRTKKKRRGKAKLW